MYACVQGSEEASDRHAQAETPKTDPDRALSEDDYITPEQLQVLREHLEKFLSKKKIVRLRRDENEAESGQHPSFATTANLRSGWVARAQTWKTRLSPPD